MEKYSACPPHHPIILLSETDAGPIYVEYNFQDNHYHDHEKNHADQTAAASASFGPEFFLSPVVNFTYQE